MKKYAIYAIEQETTEQLAMREVWPKAAQYLPFFLFPKTYEQHFGVSHSNSLDLSGIVLTDNPVLPNEKTFAEFDAMADQLLAGGFEGREVILSVQQGKYLHKTRYTAHD